ncbi:FadR/GntR family transcriptional regulator [Microbacterium sp.]|uniref:FadR/GntR family transcriptional regulator n=1 Tax=Microbacterium sp. TaxID=51671 RepID=UPI003A88519A
MQLRANSAVAMQVARTIEAEIVDNGWPNGHYLGRRQELAQRFGVAPATLGEVIQLLRSRGIVESKSGPGGGIFVSERSPFTSLSDHLLRLREGAATADQCLGVLDALDEAVLLDAVEFADADDIVEITARASALERAWGGSESTAAMWALHARIARVTPNDLLRRLYTDLVNYLRSESFEGAEGPHTAERLQTHLDFAVAVAQNDRALAESAAARHRGSTLSRRRTDRTPRI